MKAQRRHELQENQLAKVITKAPGFWEDWGGRALAAAIAVLVVVILVRYRINSNREAAASATGNLAVARTEIEELDRMGLAGSATPPQALASERRQLFNDANNAIGEAMRVSEDHKIQSEALIAKGDLYWTLATLPTIPGAATQPSLQIKDPKELLSNANEAYQTVVANYADNPFASIAARFGLAALAENRGDFDAAKAQYDKLALETKDWPAYQHVAAARLNGLDALRKQVLIAAPATIPAAPEPTSIPVTIAAPASIPAKAATTAPSVMLNGPAIHATTQSIVPTSTTAPAAAPSTQPR